MKDKERFISIDDSGESVFTFDEADMIIDTKTNIIYGANNIPDLVKILNSQSLQWQKLKEWILDIRKQDLSKELSNGSKYSTKHLIHPEKLLYKMQELEAEDIED